MTDDLKIRVYTSYQYISYIPPQYRLYLSDFGSSNVNAIPMTIGHTNFLCYGAVGKRIWIAGGSQSGEALVSLS